MHDNDTYSRYIYHLAHRRRNITTYQYGLLLQAHARSSSWLRQLHAHIHNH